ncbi:MAG: 1-deoxy-D-xylulose-5-phosphate synthase [Planctomycetes bacterium]|nr:1-deoxy-D-xylulose-5-phosphate synthase [Planctomycetota bacterium]
MPKLLSTLSLPMALKGLGQEERMELAQEIREVIMDVVPRTGGHMGTNLGVVELSIALHTIFDFSHDRLVFDVGHQAYPHKLLTGRYDRFEQLRKKGGLCGFPTPSESAYDTFHTGHAGTSISSALGLAIGNEALEENRKVVAVIGDGSICGLSFEGLNHVGSRNKKLMVILNDNKMAISPTVGAFSKYLNKLRSGETYHTFLKDFKESLGSLPVVGEALEHMGEKTMDSLRDHLLPDRFFRELGFHYYGPIDGHNLEEMIPIIKNLSEVDVPVLLHIITEKGRGAKGASEDPYKYHSPPAAPSSSKKKCQSYSHCFVKSLCKEAEKDEHVYAITAAMAQGTGLETFIEKYPERTIDTGIAEGHAVTMAGGMSVAGIKPVVLIYSTFLQRAYDNIMHDLCLQSEGNVIMALDRAGFVGDDGPSHHGVFDIAYCRHLPRMIVIAPKDARELGAMLEWSLEQDLSVAIRYPKGAIAEIDCDQPTKKIELGVPETLRKGESIALLAYGSMVIESMKAYELLVEEGVNITLINMRFAKPLHEKSYRDILESHDHIITIEEHVLMGGIGSALLELVNDQGIKTKNIQRMGVPDRFVTFASREEQFQEVGIDALSIKNKVLSCIESTSTLPL